MRISDWSSDVCSSDLGGPRSAYPEKAWLRKPLPMNEDDEEDSSHKDEPQLGGWWRRVTQRLAGGPRTRDDLLELLRDAREAELIDSDAMSMFEGIVQTTEMHVRDVMVPRAQMVIVEAAWRSEEHTSDLQSLMRISYAVFCLK